MKSAILMQRLEHLEATALSARDAFAMATIEGARALNLDTLTGSLEPGKAADIVVFDGDGTGPLPTSTTPYQKVAYCASPVDVKDVWVAGRTLGGEREGGDGGGPR